MPQKTGPLNVSKPFFSPIFFRSIRTSQFRLSLIKQFLRQKGVRPRFPQKTSFFSKEASRGSWASEAPGSRPAAVAAALRRRQRRLQQGLPALRAADVMESTAPLHVAVLRVESSSLRSSALGRRPRPPPPSRAGR